MRNATTIQSVILTAGLTISACSGTDTGGGSSAAGGASQGGVTATGGVANNAGGAATGGSIQAAGGANTGGVPTAGGGVATGGSPATGGVAAGGMNATGGAPLTGGASSVAGSVGTGGSTGAGGSTSAGGTKPTGGTTSQGGSSTAGGSKPTGGATSQGGSSTAGGSSATGGKTSAGGTAGNGNPTTGGTTGTGGASTGVTVQLDQTHQTIDGFGLNTALGGGSVPSNFYSTSGADGLGFSIVRVGMTSSGGLSGSKPSGATKVIGSAWTAPANCKDNNNTSKGGHLLTSCYDSWSTTIANFAKNQGLYAMAAANEPDFASCGSSIGPPCNGDYDTMVYTATEMVNFIKVLGPKMKTAGVKLIAPEPSEWLHLWSNASATGSTVANHPNSSDPLGCGCFSNTPTTTGCASKCTTGGGYDYGHYLAADATAWAAIDIIGTHEYDTEKAEAWPSDINGGKRNKTIYETEVSGVMYWPEQGPSSDINNGIAVAGWVHSALAVGEASAWLYWWYQSTGSNDNEGMVLQGSTAMTKRCYTIGNYSKFVRPGYVMVGVTGNSNANLLISAYTGTDGTVVVVAINKGTSAATVPISIAGGTAPASCTPYVTSSSANLAAGTAVSVSGGSFSASLAATSVTSFVCK